MFPVLFRIGSFEVYAYGVTLAIAFTVGALSLARQGKEVGLPEEKLLDLTIWIMVAAVVGSRLLYVLLELPVYLADPLAVFNVRSGGLSFHGGLIAGVVVGLWFARRNSLPQGKVADLVAPYLALGYAIVRIGCLLNGCCYGSPTDLPWALPSAYVDNTLRHPTQIYAFLAALLIFLLLLYRRRKIRFEGQLLLEFVMFYSIYRFMVEFFREVSSYVGFLTLGQAASLLGAVAAFVAIRVWPTGLPSFLQKPSRIVIRV
ncbi:MAG: prolipoprotein diacylglyceryl transferase, partial [Firmicutes bacterium]|nr:prolipoprotein diacylglyceryl transferase [Bacillota bacterium]